MTSQPPPSAPPWAHQPPAPPPGPHPPGSSRPGAPPRRLVRLTDQGKVAGVAAGLGWYFGIDPALVRIGLVVLTIATGVGIPAYIIAWILLPDARSADTAMSRPPRQRDARSLAMVGLTIAAAIILLGQIDVFSGQVLTAAVLVGVGVLLFSDGDRLRGAGTPSAVPPPPAAAPARPAPPAPSAAPAPRTPPPPVPPMAGPPAAGPPMVGGPPLAGTDRQSAYAPYAGAWAPDGRPAADAGPHHGRGPRRPPSRLGLLGFGAWLATLGVAVLLDRLGAVDLTPVATVGLTLAVIGATLLVGTLFGRARGVIGLGIFASLLLIPLSALGASSVDLEGGFGQRVHTPRSVDAIQDEYSLVAGEQVIDLTDLDLAGQTVVVDVGMVAGELTVIVPADVDVDVSGHLTAGERTIFGQTLNGTDLQLDGAQAGEEGNGRIQVELSVIFGEVVVESVAPAPSSDGPR